MKLKDLKSCIDQAYANTKDGNVDVEVIIEGDEEEKAFKVVSVGQFGFVPDVNITISPIS